jgi:hypothetical protein
MAAPLVLVPLIAYLIRALQIMFAVKAVLWIVKIMGTLGLAFATNEYLMEPLIDTVTAAWEGLPADAVMWGRALGLTEVASIFISAYTLLSGKKVFLAAVGR